MMKKVLIQYSSLPHYRIPLFNLLSEKFDLTVLYAPHTNTRETLSGIDGGNGNIVHFNLIRSKYIEFKIFGILLQYQTKLIKAVLSRDYHVVVMQINFQNFTTIITLLLCRLMNISVIYWTKGFAVESKRGLLAKYLIFKNLYKIPDLHLSYGDQSTEYLMNYGVENRKIVKAYNTIDVEQIHKRKTQLIRKGWEFLKQYFIQEDTIVIATVGRLIKKKRVIDFCELIQKLAQDDIHCIGIIVGDGPEKMNLVKWVNDHHLENRLLFTGEVPLDMDNAIIAISDIVVFCGGVGLAINQAMALNTLVVIADESGSDGEVVKHNITGFRYPKGNINMLYRQINQILTNKSNYTDIIQNAEYEILHKRNLFNYCQSFKTAIDQFI